MEMARHSIHIDRTPREVFDFFADFSKAARWRQYVRTMTPRDPGPPRAGSVIDVVMDVVGHTQAFELTVLACEPPTLWRHHTNEKHFRGHVEYRFDPENGGTRATLTMVARPVGLYGWLAMPILWINRPKSYAQQLPQLKQAMEAGVEISCLPSTP